MQNEDHALREALGFGGTYDASLNLQGALDDLRGRFDPKDGGVIAGTIERVIDQLEAARAALSATPPQEASSVCMLSGCMDFSESSTPTHAPIGNEALVEKVCDGAAHRRADEIADKIANGCAYKPDSANHARVWQAARAGAMEVLGPDAHARAVLALPSIATVEQSSKVQSALLEEAIGALEDVVNPLGHLQREADADGARLSGMAYSITNDLSFVQQIARATLAKLKEGRA